MKGTVQELKLPEKGSEKEGARFTLKSGDNTLDVYLCPKSFLDDMGSSLAKGDEVSLTGSKVKQDGADLILAREVVKGRTRSYSATTRENRCGIGINRIVMRPSPPTAYGGGPLPRGLVPQPWVPVNCFSSSPSNTNQFNL